METLTIQEQKDHMRAMEKALRLAGEKLDVLWLKARTMKGLERTSVHMEIKLLREKQNLDRKEHEALKKAQE